MPRQQQHVPQEWIHAAVPGLKEAVAALEASDGAHHSARHFVRVAEFLGTAFWHNLPIKQHRLGDSYMQLWQGTAIAELCSTGTYWHFADRIKYVHQFGATTTQQRLQNELGHVRHNMQAMQFHMHRHMAAMQHQQHMMHQQQMQMQTQQMQMLHALCGAASMPAHSASSMLQGQLMPGHTNLLEQQMGTLQLQPAVTEHQVQQLVLDDDDGVGEHAHYCPALP